MSKDNSELIFSAAMGFFFSSMGACALVLTALVVLHVNDSGGVSTHFKSDIGRIQQVGE